MAAGDRPERGPGPSGARRCSTCHGEVRGGEAVCPLDGGALVDAVAGGDADAAGDAAAPSPPPPAPYADGPMPAGALPLPRIEVPVFEPARSRRPRAAARIALVVGGAAAALAVSVWRGAQQGDPPPPLPPPTQAAPAAAVPAAATLATLAIDSGPRSANVFVDGEHRGRTPLRLDRIAAGTHTIRLELRGYEEVEAQKDVRAGRAESFFAALKARRSGTGR